MDTIQKIISLIDLTSLNLDDTDEKISKLCRHAQTKMGNVAAVCVYPQFIKLAKQQLADTNILVATVVNFPHGKDPLFTVLEDIVGAIDQGADEIDVVIPYHELKDNAPEKVSYFVRQCKQACEGRCLKTILETGELTSQEIAAASEAAIAGGADFLKTSTGKVQINATPKAAEIMLAAIKDSGKSVGLKISGGVRTKAQAEQYINLAADVMGHSFINSKTFRIGASSLLDDLLQTHSK